MMLYFEDHHILNFSNLVILGTNCLLIFFFSLLNKVSRYGVSVVKIITKCFPFLSVMYIHISFTID